MSSVDTDRALLIEAFVADSEQNLARMEEALLAMEARPEDPELIGEVFRSVHSLKGDASIVGLTALAELAHGVEDLLDRLRDRSLAINAALISDLLRAVDAFRTLVPAALAGELQITPRQEALFARLAAVHHSPPGGAPPPAGPFSDDGADAGASERSHQLRVDLRKLDALLMMAGEIATLRRRLGRLLPPGPAVEIHEEIDRLSQLMQSEILQARMVPVGPIFRQYLRVVRDLAAAHGKEIQFAVEGADVEVDAAMIGAVRDALTHMIRNAIDHGIESPASRRRQGKPAVGRILVRARHESGSIVIQVADDGAGFSRERILASARGRGLSGAEGLSDDDLYRLVLEPGFSTAERVTELSGRGVGLDVVRRVIEAQRGTLSIESREGAGSTLTLRLPLTLSLIDGFYVGAGDAVYVLPLGAVGECVELPSSAAAGLCGIVNLRGEALPYVRLQHWINGEGAPLGRTERESLVVIGHEGRRAGIVVDQVLGESQTVVKSLGPLFKRVAAVAGSSITADGRVALILDVPAILRDVVSRSPGTPRTEERSC